jgi:hypothetical protein
MTIHAGINACACQHQQHTASDASFFTLLLVFPWKSASKKRAGERGPIAGAALGSHQGHAAPGERFVDLDVAAERVRDLFLVHSNTASDGRSYG